jgi:hypothetical protein
VDNESWLAIDSALRRGIRGLLGGTSLAQLLDEERGVRERANPATPAERLRAWEAEQFPSRPPRRQRPAQPQVTMRLTIDLILSWADAQHAATDQWPSKTCGPVRDYPDLTWSQVNRALRQGLRGLPGGTTLADLLQEQRGVRYKHNRPRLDVEQILVWADDHLQATGKYPDSSSGPVRAAPPPGETWAIINSALYHGRRGLPGGSSLSRLLIERRGHRGPLTIERILAWADAHHGATGRWPTFGSSGPVRDVPGETWVSLNIALGRGRRGLPGGTTLARVLAEFRQAPNIYTELPLSVERILAWAEAHHAATGQWPSSKSGPVLGAEGERWKTIETALRVGHRGLPGGQSFGRLIRAYAGPDAYRTRPRLTVEQILAWADAHHEATGSWPVEDSGPVRSAPGESWRAISLALSTGGRGLPGGSSLARLLAKDRGVRIRYRGAFLTTLSGCSLDSAARRDRPRLTVDQVLQWADTYRAATGRWPNATSGPVEGMPGETWVNLNTALQRGRRGLPRGTSLRRLIHEHRGASALAAEATPTSD